jgi:hypothetical protein
MAMAPANYSGLANLMNLQGVGVNPTSQLAYVPSKDLMTRYQTIPNPSTGIPQAMGVTGMAEGGMPSQQYPMQEEAMELANRGRYGDTTLVHMTPGEVQGLASLGQLTINPDTGLPEAFNMKSLLPIIGGIAGSFLLPGAGTALGAGFRCYSYWGRFRNCGWWITCWSKLRRSCTRGSYVRGYVVWHRFTNGCRRCCWSIKTCRSNSF